MLVTLAWIYSIFHQYIFVPSGAGGRGDDDTGAAGDKERRKAGAQTSLTLFLPDEVEIIALTMLQFLRNSTWNSKQNSHCFVQVL